MNKVPFFPWAQPSSTLGYGTTSFMSADTTNERLALLEFAYDAGITHFDTAAYYGYGEAERLLGKFLIGRRDKVTVTTKFGIEPSGAVKAQWVNLLARKIFALVPCTKKLLHLRRPNQGSRWGVFEHDKARNSLDRSLRALRTDFVDLFLLHEPSLSDAGTESLIAFLETEKQRGRIRAYGCGGDGDAIESMVQAHLPTANWLQFEDNAVNRRLDRLQNLTARCITFAPFNSALPTISKWLAANPDKLQHWSTSLEIDCSSLVDLAGLLQATSHWRNSNGIVLFSSSNRQRITRAAEVAAGDRFSREQILEFLNLTAELRI
jgi:D-threo-aldose 1-dehydrogenase